MPRICSFACGYGKSYLEGFIADEELVKYEISDILTKRIHEFNARNSYDSKRSI